MISIQFGSLMNRDLRYTPTNLSGLGTETSKKTAKIWFQCTWATICSKTICNNQSLFMYILCNFSNSKRQRHIGTKKMKTYRDLIVWQKSMVLFTEVYKISKEFPQ